MELGDARVRLSELEHAAAACERERLQLGERLLAATGELAETRIELARLEAREGQHQEQVVGLRDALTAVSERARALEGMAIQALARPLPAASSAARRRSSHGEGLAT